MTPLTFVCLLHIDPDRWDDSVDRMRDAVTTFRGEPGCLRYEINGVRDDPSTLVLIESYVSEAALDAHRVSPGIAPMRAALGLLRTRPSDIYPITPLSMDVEHQPDT